MPCCKHCSVLVIGFGLRQDTPPSPQPIFFKKSSENDFHCPAPAGGVNFQLRSQWLEVEAPEGVRGGGA